MSCVPVTWLAALAVVAQVFLQTAVASEEGAPAAPRTDTYQHLLTRTARETFDRIRAYCRERPAAADHRSACLDLMDLARKWGWEAEAREAAEQLVKQPDLEPASLRDAHAVLAIGAARDGDRGGSAAAFNQFLRSLRLRNPNEATDLAQSLALVWQLRGDREAAAGVYEQLTAAFFLNAEVAEFATARTQRLTLVGQACPPVELTDLVGRPIRLPDFAGRVLLLDFWATNCRPCLEELPGLRQLYRDTQPRGLEILGLSFDDDRELLDQFLKQERISWRVALGRSVAEQTFHVHLIPCLMLVDRQGRIAAVDVRPFDLRRTVEGLLEPPTQ